MKKKKLILVASPPACGKTYVSEELARRLGNAVYLDKDDLSDLVRAAFAIGGEELNMDGEFYVKNIRPAEYSTVIGIALSVLRFSQTVILTGPFTKEVRSTEYIRSLKMKAAELDAEFILIWVHAPLEVCRERMIKRASDRDLLKLKDFDSYAKNINYVPPYELEREAAVDQLFVFETGNSIQTEESFAKALKIING